MSLLWWFTNSAYPFSFSKKETMKKKSQIGSSVPSPFCHGMSTLGSPKVRWISRTFRPSVAASCPPPCAKCPETLSRSSRLPGWHSCGIRCGFWAQSVGEWKGTRKVESLNVFGGGKNEVVWFWVGSCGRKPSQFVGMGLEDDIRY